MRNHWRPSSRVLLSPLDDRNGVFQRFECVWASRHQTSRSGLESTTRATQTQPAGQDLQEACEFHKRRRTEKQNRMNDVKKNKKTNNISLSCVSLLLVRSTRRCLFPTAVYSLPAWTLWTPCPTLPPSGTVAIYNVGAARSSSYYTLVYTKGTSSAGLPRCWLIPGAWAAAETACLEA